MRQIASGFVVFVLSLSLVDAIPIGYVVSTSPFLRSIIDICYRMEGWRQGTRSFPRSIELDGR